jgi:hypothetical protein
MPATFTVPSIFTAVDKFSGPIKVMANNVHAFSEKSRAALDRMDKKFGDLQKKSQNIAKDFAIGGAVIGAPIAIATKNAVEFEDRMADVAKTTGISGATLDKFGGELLDLASTTRTSITEIQGIAAIGGSLGIAENQLLNFVDTANKFNVALGKDFGGVENASRASFIQRNKKS